MKQSYIIDTLDEALKVCDFFLENLHPFESYHFTQLDKMVSGTVVGLEKLRQIWITAKSIDEED